MGFFDKKNTTNTTQYTTNNNANLQAQGPAVLGESNNLTVISTDRGAIAAGVSLGNNALGINAAALKSGFSLAENSQEIAADLTLGLIDRYTDATAEILDRAIGSAEKQGKEARDFTLQAVKSESQEISERLISTGGVIAAVVVLGMILKA